MNRIGEGLLGASIPLLVIFYLSVAPYSKVEESFNLQATHDILTSGIPFQNVREYLSANYDHMTFTGSVPRTFVGPLALAGAAWPFAWLAHGVDKQILVRAILGLYNSFCILSYRNALSRVFGRGTANWYLLLQASQFHIMFWASRTLPNFFAFGFSTFALRYLLPRTTSFNPSTPSGQTAIRREQASLTILTILGIVFRSELAVFLSTHTFLLFLTQRLTRAQVLSSGLLGAALGLSLTIPIDSFFWHSFPLWPELRGFTYNILHSSASNWGVSPWHFYLSSSLPKLLFNPLTYLVCLPFSLLAPALRPSTLTLITPSLAFIALYSLIPHKEWRFVIYAVPPLTAASARGADYIWTRRAKSAVYRTLGLTLVVSIAASFLASAGLLAVSSSNYPGAEALNRLHAMAHGTQPVIKVHMDTLACMTGVTRFLQVPERTVTRVDAQGRVEEGAETRWVYDKTDREDVLLRPEFWAGFDYVLAERPERVPGAWEVVGVVEGFAGLRVVRPGDKEGEGEGDGMERWSRPWAYGEGPWVPVERWVGCEEGILARMERIGRKVTGGWWVRMRMEESIQILKRGKEPVVLGVQLDGDGNMCDIHGPSE